MPGSGMERFLQKDTKPEPKRPRRPVAFECAITDDVDSISERATVKELHGNEFVHSGCRWEPRVTVDGDALYPERGDTALVMLDDNDNPWIVAWWPYG